MVSALCLELSTNFLVWQEVGGGSFLLQSWIDVHFDNISFQDI
jgi:hypothetical protein